MEPRGVNNLLREFEAAGDKDSDGIFTISAEKSREKLREYQLPDPRMYILNLLSSAVCGGATYLQVELTSNELQASYDGEAVSEDELIRIFDHLLSNTDRRLSELGVALNACSSLDPVELVFQSGDSEGAYEWRWCEGRPSVSVSPPLRSPMNRLSLTEFSTFRRMGQSLFSQLTEQYLLKNGAAYAPLRVTINGKDIIRTLELGLVSPNALCWAFFRRSTNSVKVQQPDSDWAPYCQVLEETWDEDFDILFTIQEPAAAQNQGITFINNGVSFHRGNQVLDIPFCSATIYCSLPKNASHTDLVEQNRYRELLMRARQIVVRTLLSRLQGDLPVPDQMVAPLFYWAERFGNQAGDLASDKSALSRWIKEIRFLRDLTDRELWKSVSQEFQALPDGEERVRTEQRLRKALVTGARLNFEGGRYHGSSVLVGRLSELGGLSRSPWMERARRDTCLISVLAGENRIAELDSYGCHRTSGLALRMLNKPESVRLMGLPRAEQAAVYIALENFPLATECLRHCPEIEESPMHMETLADVLFFAPDSTKESRLESLEWRSRAIELRENQASGWGDFLSQDIVRLARAVKPFTTWIVSRAKTSVQSRIVLQPARTLEDEVNGAVKMSPLTLSGHVA